MSKKIENLKVYLDEDLEEKLRLIDPLYSDFKVLKKSLDARQRHSPHFNYTLDLYTKGAKAPKIEFQLEKISRKVSNDERPIIIGSGPAGLFAALRLVERGIPCILLEQGSPTKERLKDIAQYWRKGKLNPDNNVCHGEGGAGLFSDGKLITRIKSPHIKYVMNQLVKFGAPEEIEYLSNPHVGSDKIRRVIPVMREYLESHGCTIYFNTKVKEITFTNKVTSGVKCTKGQVFKSPHVILACGHSATDVFEMLRKKEVYMEAKPFAIGLRVEHPQEAVNKIQYRDYYDHPKLGSANYKLTYNNKSNGVGVYSFCMCPGGYVLSSSTEVDGVVCNGMSNYRRNSPFANSAIVVTLDMKDPKNVFAGLNYRRKLEKQTMDLVKQAGGYKELPVQTLENFMKNKKGDIHKSSSLSGEVSARLNTLFTPEVNNELKNAFEKFNTSMKGFIHPKAQVFGVESRTSCPLRVTRDPETFESLSHKGLFPCGEGAGYAGGITSAACDGIRIAEVLYHQFKDRQQNHYQ